MLLGILNFNIKEEEKTITSEENARIQLELMPITELEKIYQEYKEGYK